MTSCLIFAFYSLISLPSIVQKNLSSHIEGLYNRQRIHSALGYLTPEQMEKKTGHPLF